MVRGNHEYVVKIKVEGPVDVDLFHRWVATEADRLGVQGWTRMNGEGVAIMLFAGDTFSVMTLLALFTENETPVLLDNVVEQPLRGDEPIWSGFHYI